MRRRLMLARVLFLAVSVTLGLKAPLGAAQATGAPQGGEKKAEEQFKNIQVLKGIPADQLVPTMQFISASLGVECDFCHAQGAFEKDDKKPKQTARKMMQMMYAINKDNFDAHRVVTCNSCHRGSRDPKAIPVVMGGEEFKEEDGEPEAGGTKVSRGPAADQLIDKYIEALGGSSSVDRVTSRVMKGTLEFGEKSFPIEIYSKDPDKRISFTHMPEGESVTAFNGHEGWLAMTGRPAREMRGSDLDGAAMDADLHLASHLKQMFSKLETRGSDKVGDRETYLVLGERDGKPPIRLYFDQQTGLLVRMVRFGDTALGLLPTQIDYADYRDSGGEKVPYRWTLARPGGRFTIQVNEMKQNVPVDDSKFAKPPAPPAGSKPPAKAMN